MVGADAAAAVAARGGRPRRLVETPPLAVVETVMLEEAMLDVEMTLDAVGLGERALDRVVLVVVFYFFKNRKKVLIYKLNRLIYKVRKLYFQTSNTFVFIKLELT